MTSAHLSSCVYAKHALFASPFVCADVNANNSQTITASALKSSKVAVSVCACRQVPSLLELCAVTHGMYPGQSFLSCGFLQKVMDPEHLYWSFSELQDEVLQEKVAHAGAGVCVCVCVRERGYIYIYTHIQEDTWETTKSIAHDW